MELKIYEIQWIDGGNVTCMISWGLRGTNQSKYTDARARQDAENNTETPINYTYC